MGYFKYETCIVDDNAEIGEGTKIWHFCHVQDCGKEYEMNGTDLKIQGGRTELADTTLLLSVRWAA
ncbi:hypothetical protein [Schaedlerella arabinosiphila]|uniref:hypothetical protein n=1 Tax=Schaedlerella arabinosiphila TaxID=2044587 RepID=UPI0002CCD4F8|nr:hypothetical protein [Schaedlerella arabinosiphila]KAI4443539.1 hypothetical protein C824_006075 [Schaedlerella arabinosiphila]